MAAGTRAVIPPRSHCRSRFKSSLPRGCSASSKRRGPEPLAQFDRIAVGVANLGARVGGLLHRSPRGLDAARLEFAERAVHVHHLEREALPTQSSLAAARRAGAARLGLIHDLERRIAELEIDKLERTI